MFSSEWQWFFDESGNSGNAPLLVIAGFLAKADAWALFSEAWKSELANDSESPALQYFKASEAQSLHPKGQFSRERGWNEDKRDARVRRLVHIIRQHVSLRASASVRPEHFATYLRSLPSIGRRLATDHPYPHLLSRLIGVQLVLSHREGVLHPHDIVLDQQTGMENEIQELWPDFKRAVAKERPQYARLMGPRPFFLDDTQFMPLQAADLYAWHVRTHREGGDEKLDRVLRMLSKVPTKHQHVSARDLEASHERLLVEGERRKALNPALDLIGYPSGKREQWKARRAYAKKRGANPSPRRSS